MKLVSILVLLAACGDDVNSIRPDAPVQPDASDDAPPDASPFVAPTPFAVPLSAAGPDQLQTVIAGPDNTFLAAGFAAPALTGPRPLVVVKFTPTGPDPTFGGGDGIATTTVDFRGGSDEIDLATQSDGKILVSGTVANATDPDDRDVAVLRLKADGTLDTTFGGGDGIATLDLSKGHDNGTMLVGLDASRGLAVGPGDTIYVHALQRGEGTAGGGGPRIDTDFTVVKLTTLGVIDPTFGGGDGKFLLDITESNATARGIKVFADGTILAGGYANSPGVGTTQPVLYKLTAAGELDPAFASGGVFHETVLAVQTEVYNFAVHGTKFVTGGYGRSTGDQNDWVSLRFDLATGERDLTWGDSGTVLIDASGAMIGDNCRNAIALPDGKTALVGSTGPSNMPGQDAVFAILDSTGALDTTYGDGLHSFPLGANGNDQFWGGAVSGNYAAFVGYKGGGMTQTETVNDDAYGVILPLQ